MPSRCIDPGDATLGHGHGADLVQQAHPFHDGAAGTSKINSLPARAWRRRALDDGDRMKPASRSQYAAAVPAMPAPDMRISRVLMKLSVRSYALTLAMVIWDEISVKCTRAHFEDLTVCSRAE